MAVFGAANTNCLGCGSGQPAATSADSKLVIEMSAPDSSLAMLPSSAVTGSAASRAASGPSKCTSPPNASVTGFPSPVQPGDSGELLVRCRARPGASWPGTAERRGGRPAAALRLAPARPRSGWQPPGPPPSARQLSPAGDGAAPVARYARHDRKGLIALR